MGNINMNNEESDFDEKVVEYKYKKSASMPLTSNQKNQMMSYDRSTNWASDERHRVLGSDDRNLNDNHEINNFGTFNQEFYPD